MALKIELKPGERIIIGDALITNDGHRARFSVKGDAPILREPDILLPKDAITPCQKIYLAVQTMYLCKNPSEQSNVYKELAEDLLKAAPSTAPHIKRINNNILTGSFYKALKDAKALITYEKELMDHAGSN